MTDNTDVTFVEQLSALDTPMISDARVERLLADGALTEALEMARDNLHSAHDDAADTASSLADLAWVTSMTGAIKPALQAALQSIDLAPTSRQAFHNLAAILLASSPFFLKLLPTNVLFVPVVVPGGGRSRVLCRSHYSSIRPRPATP